MGAKHSAFCLSLACKLLIRPSLVLTTTASSNGDNNNIKINAIARLVPKVWMSALNPQLSLPLCLLLMPSIFFERIILTVKLKFSFPQQTSSSQNRLIMSCLLFVGCCFIFSHFTTIPSNCITRYFVTIKFYITIFIYF